MVLYMKHVFKDKYKMSLLCITIGIVISVLNTLFIVITGDLSYFTYVILLSVSLFIIGIIFFLLFMLERKRNE